MTSLPVFRQMFGYSTLPLCQLQHPRCWQISECLYNTYSGVRGVVKIWPRRSRALPNIRNNKKTGAFSTDAQSQYFLKVSWDLQAYFDTADGALLSLQFCIFFQTRLVIRTLQFCKSNARGPKGVVSPQKFLQGSETEKRELLGGMDEKSISPTTNRRFFLTIWPPNP